MEPVLFNPANAADWPPKVTHAALGRETKQTVLLFGEGQYQTWLAERVAEAKELDQELTIETWIMSGEGPKQYEVIETRIT